VTPTGGADAVVQDGGRVSRLTGAVVVAWREEIRAGTQLGRQERRIARGEEVRRGRAASHQPREETFAEHSEDRNSRDARLL